MTKKIIISAEHISKYFNAGGSITGHNTIIALDDVNIQIPEGKTIGIAGESGCGKSTLGKILAGLITADKGTLFFQEKNMATLNKEDFKKFRRKTQMIFQDPFSSLNPRMRIGDIISEPMILAGIKSEKRQNILANLMDTVGLSEEMAGRFPDEFSGGQRQRIGIARALSASPSLIIADEPVSALDISIQAQIINLLQKMKQDFNLTLVIISHNLAVLRHLSDSIVIMYLGSIVEEAPAYSVFTQCRHPYTEALMAAIPDITGTKNLSADNLLTDDLPSPLSIPSGCRFHTRCRYAKTICSKQKPELKPVAENHRSACHFSETIFS